MRLTYKLDRDDYYAFNFEQMKHFPNIQRNINIQRFVIPVIFSVIVLLLLMINKKDITGIAPIYLLLVAAWILLYPKILQKSTAKRLNKVLSAEENQILFEERTIEVNDTGLYGVAEKEGKEELVLAAEKILKIHENDNYFYVFLSTQSVYIVPKKFFTDKEEMEEFKKSVEKIIQE